MKKIASLIAALSLGVSCLLVNAAKKHEAIEKGFMTAAGKRQAIQKVVTRFYDIVATSTISSTIAISANGAKDEVITILDKCSADYFICNVSRTLSHPTWSPGKTTLRGVMKVIASDKPGFWQPEPGYQWKTGGGTAPRMESENLDVEQQTVAINFL